MSEPLCAFGMVMFGIAMAIVGWIEGVTHQAALLRALKDLREQVDAHVVVVGCSHFNTRLATEVIDRIEK